MIWSLLALSVLYSWWSLSSLDVERRVWLPRSAASIPDLAEPTEDGVVEVRIRVHNRGRLPRFLVKVVEDTPLDAPSLRPRTFLVAAVGPGSSAAFSYNAVCFRRGRYTSAEAALEMAAPLGLFVRRRRFELPLGVTVYPAHNRMDAMPAAREVWADDGQRVRSAAASEFYGSRDYQHGDPLRHIHWRNTARRGQFVVKEFEETSQGSVAVAFETARDWGDGRETTVEYSIRLAASLAHYCGDSGQAIGILAPPSPLPVAHWLEAMDYLAGLKVGAAATLDKLTENVEAGQSLVAVVPALEIHLLPSLFRLADRDVRLTVVILEGFAEEEATQEFFSRLGGSGISLVRCPRGDLKAAVDALGRSLLLAS